MITTTHKLAGCLEPSFTPGLENVKSAFSGGPQNILLPPLQIKLGLVKNCAKAIDKDGTILKFLQMKFFRISEATLQAGIFDGPQIREFPKTRVCCLSAVEKRA